MARFKFRLQKVLDYRRHIEGLAMDAMLECRARRIEAEHDIEKVQRVRTKVLTTECERVEQMLTLETYMTRLDDEERDHQTVLALLMSEEESAEAKWREAKRDVEALEKLLEQERAQFELEQNRREQREQDEWAAQRRVS